MKKLFLALFFITSYWSVGAQSNNPISIYEGERVNEVRFKFDNLPQDTLVATNIMLKVKGAFRLFPQTQYSDFFATYYITKIRQQPFVKSAQLEVFQSADNGVNLLINVVISADSRSFERTNVFKNGKLFPVIFSSPRSYVTLKFSASEMAYSNLNAWFGQPDALTNGNPLATNPVGEGYTAWLEGFGALGLYGIVNIIPKINLHIYGGGNYLVAYSAGTELFTDKSRIYGATEELFAGVVGGGVDRVGHTYKYNVMFGRKQFTLADGFLIVNTSMNGDNRAALQLNPRWAAKEIFQAGFVYDRLKLQTFMIKPNELDILNSNTILAGVDLELGNKDRYLLGATWLTSPKSNFKYYLPNGDVCTRAGLQVYNLRFSRSARPMSGGLFFKAEGAYEWNKSFKMSAWAYYGEVGWNFATVAGSPSVSYRYASFSGDNPDTESYNRWDALYTGGTGEQWVQGSNMYKVVQNSNEISHRLQAIYMPFKKVQLVGQVWLFYADQLNNLGGNPALSFLQSKSYGSELNLTVKYFMSRAWYFHLNTAYTFAGKGVKDIVPNTKDWFCLSVFARYNF